MSKAQTGQKKYRPRKRDRDIVLQLGEKGLPQEMICSLVENPATGKPISKPTLYKHFKKELALGKANAGVMISDWVFDSARTGNPNVRMFLARTRLGWKETSVLEIPAFDPVEARLSLHKKFDAAAPPDIIEAEYEEDETD